MSNFWDYSTWGSINLIAVLLLGLLVGNMLKKYCGKSFSAYLKEKRLNEASELLKTTDLSVTEVMERVGYSDKKLFYAHFKEMFGNTPGKYR